MAYNTELEYKIDLFIKNDNRISKKKMFGGTGYLLNGNMCFGIYKYFLIVITTPEKGEELLKNDQIRIFDITGRPMKGWLMVSPDLLNDRTDLAAFLQTGLDFAVTLPEKT